MTVVKINTFDGGLAQDTRTFAINQNTTSVNFDIFNDGHYMTPYVDQIAETMVSGTTTDFALTDVDMITVAGTASMVALGQENSGSAKPTFFRKNSTTDVTSSWQLYATGTGTKLTQSLVVYKDNAYCLALDGASNFTLQKFDGVSTVTTIGTLAGAFTSAYPRPFVHPLDNVMYSAVSNIISRYDGTTFTATAFTLPSNKVVVSMCDYGQYLAILCRHKNNSANSTIYLWGRDTSLTTLQGSIDLGAVQGNIIENLNNVLIVVCTMSSAGNYTTINDRRLVIKGYAGGAVTTIKNFQISTSYTINNYKFKNNDKLYFGFGGDTGIYCFGRNDTEYFLSKDRAYPASPVLQNLNGLSMVGNVLFTAYSSASVNNYFYRTRISPDSLTYNNVSSWTSTVNQGIVIEDRYRQKQLNAMYIAFTGGTLVNLKYSFDGGSTLTAVASSDTGEVVIEATKNTDDSPLGNGRELTITVESTGNAKIKEIAYRYEIMDTQVNTSI